MYDATLDRTPGYNNITGTTNLDTCLGKYNNFLDHIQKEICFYFCVFLSPVKTGLLFGWSNQSHAIRHDMKPSAFS